MAYASEPRVEPMYHGTGDVFASVLVAGLVYGKALDAAARTAVRFTVDAIRRTKAAGTDNRFGIDFEAGLAELGSMMDPAERSIDIV
jgi:pyridoxine kinase